MLNICIIGLGQIGASLGIALKNSHNKKYKIIGIARRKETLKEAKKLKAVDECSLNLEAAKFADICVICLPANLISSTYKKLSKIVNNQSLISDVGSVKREIEREILFLARNYKYPDFIGVHPMAGKEKSGIFSAEKNLFKGATVVMTGSIKKNSKNEKLIENLWKDAGANIVKTDAEKHDNLAAFSSHLPHLIAFSLTKMYAENGKKEKLLPKIISGSFKSVTRVAASSADMWAPIFFLNNKNLEKYVNKFIKELLFFKRILKNENRLKREILKIQNGQFALEKSTRNDF
jgi:prephenate dehydrogenase